MASGVSSGKRGRRRGSGRPALGPRSLIALALAGFFIVAMGVIARRTVGIGQARTLRAMERQRDAIEAARVKLEVEIREASSRARLAPIAEKRLHMYVPADSQVVFLKHPPPDSAR